jgi:hypothetical protein
MAAVFLFQKIAGFADFSIIILTVEDPQRSFNRIVNYLLCMSIWRLSSLSTASASAVARGQLTFAFGAATAIHATQGWSRKEKDPGERRPEPDRHREPSPLGLVLQSLYLGANSLVVLEIFCRVRRLEVRQLSQGILPLGALPKGLLGLLFKGL